MEKIYIVLPQLLDMYGGIRKIDFDKLKVFNKHELASEYANSIFENILYANPYNRHFKFNEKEQEWEIEEDILLDGQTVTVPVYRVTIHDLERKEVS